MEYRINKIEPEIRQRINEERSESKVHNKKGIIVNKDYDGAHSDNNKKTKFGKKKNNSDESEITEIVEDDKGHFIDIRK